MKYKMYLLRNRSQNNSHQNTAKDTLTGNNQSQESQVMPSNEENQKMTKSMPRHLHSPNIYPSIDIGLNTVTELTRDKTSDNYHRNKFSLCTD